MKFLVVFSCLLAVALAKPGFLSYAVVPGAPIGLDGRVVDTPEVSLAKAAHAAAHINERLNLNREALRSADLIVAAPAAAAVPLAPAAYAAAPVAFTAPLTYVASDPRPLDTPEVALAKAAHLSAHATETARNLGLIF